MACVGTYGTSNFVRSARCLIQVAPDVQANDEATLCGYEPVIPRGGKRELELFAADKRISRSRCTSEYLATIVA